MVSVPACVLHPYDRWPSSLSIDFFHTDASFFTSPCTPIFYLWYHSDMVHLWFHCDLIFYVSTYI